MALVTHYLVAAMAYRRDAVVAQLIAFLQRRPTGRLKDAAIDLKIDRHTIVRALELENQGFRELRYQVIQELALNLMNGAPPCSLKEAAYRLGFNSSSALSHYLTRHRTRCFAPQMSLYAPPRQPKKLSS